MKNIKKILGHIAFFKTKVAHQYFWSPLFLWNLGPFPSRGGIHLPFLWTWMRLVAASPTSTWWAGCCVLSEAGAHMVMWFLLFLSGCSPLHSATMLKRSYEKLQRETSWKASEHGEEPRSPAGINHQKCESSNDCSPTQGFTSDIWLLVIMEER